MWLRARRGRPVHDLPPSENRRLVAGFQTGFLAVMLWPTFEPPLTTVASALFALSLLASFGRDWLVVSGAVDAESSAYAYARRTIKQWVERYLPPAARILGTGIGVYLFSQAVPTFSLWRATFAGGNAPDTLFALLVFALGLALPLFALGILGRVAALGVIGLAFLDAAAHGATGHIHALLLACGVIVLHAGAGLGAFWQPEDLFLYRRLGETPQEKRQKVL
jgi:CDP-diacylglycerol--glycerol-3-phosphate 3-phosphatidyltransferase